MGGRKRKSRNWLTEKRRDPFARQARQAGYRSRAAYKLREIDQRDRLFTGCQRVLDVGAAPGGWSQYARERLVAAAVAVAVDPRPMDPIAGVTFVQGDFTDPAVQERLRAAIRPHSYDLVLSDMAPNITGIADVDQANAANLAEAVIGFSLGVLAKNGFLVVKVFAGGEAARIRRLGELRFRHAVVRKPHASRDKSREYYLVLRGPKAGSED